jgi:L-2,4-diaminobutyric acid acetyltransferase
MSMATESAALPGSTDPSPRQAAFRTPEPGDGLTVWRMVRDTPGLDTNSPYYYTLWFRDFAGSSLVATAGGEIVGFLTGYRRPDEPETFMVWQTAVSPRHGIPFLGVKLFEQAADRQVRAGARFIEATVSADNKAIIMVLRQYARRNSADIERRVLFPADCFPDDHHEEVLYRIGPLTPHATEEAQA